MRKEIEADLDILRYEGREITEEFEAEFCKIIIEHLLRKFYCFYLHLMHLITFS